MMRIEEAVLHDLASAPSAPPIERVRRRARQRRARIWATGLVAVIAIAACVAVVARSVHQPSRIAVRPAVGPTAPSDVVMFNDNGGVSAVNFAARTVTHIPLTGWRSGDQPFLSLRIGADLVAGWGDVYATPLSGGPPHLLGTGVVVPALEPGAVWLTSYGKVQTPTERLVDMHGNVLLQGPTPHDAQGRAYVAITGVPGGLALQTENGLAIWNARTGRIIRRLGSGGVTALPMSGSVLAWCDHCDRTLELTDFTTGVTRSVAVSLNGGFLVMDGYFAFSPDGNQLAIPAQPDGAAPSGATTKVVIVNVTTGKVTSQLDTHARYATIAWSPDSERLYIAASESGSGGRVLLYDQITSTTRDLGPVPDQSGSFSAVITPAQAAHFPTPTTATADTCPGPPVTLASGGQTVTPVAVPCGCPSARTTPIPTTDLRRTGVRASDAALQWIRHVNPKWRAASASIQVVAVYAVGVTSQGQYGDVFAESVPKYCGVVVADATYVVEMVNPTEHDTGSQADVAIAHFASGWQVWGAYHP